MEGIFDIANSGNAVEFRECSGCSTLGGEDDICGECYGGCGIDTQMTARGEGEGRAMLEENGSQWLFLGIMSSKHTGARVEVLWVSSLRCRKSVSSAAMSSAGAPEG